MQLVKGVPERPEILKEYQRVAKTLADQFAGFDLRPILELLTKGAPRIKEKGC